MRSAGNHKDNFQAGLKEKAVSKVSIYCHTRVSGYPKPWSENRFPLSRE